MNQELNTFRFAIVWFCTTFIRVLHELHKTGKVQREKALSRLGVWITLSYFAMQRLPQDIKIMWIEAFWPAIFLIALMWMEILDFILSKDIYYFINLFTKKWS